MREKAIEMGVVLLGEGGDQIATTEWEKMKTALFGGREPMPAALAHFGEEDLKAAGVMLVFAKAWGKLFSGTTPGLTPASSASAPEEDTSAGFKAKRAKKYTAFALATFYANTSDDPDLNAEIDRRTGVAPWVIAVDGKVLAKESAPFIDWLANGDEPPAGVMVGNVKVQPVRRGEEKTSKKFREDPSAPGKRLPVDLVSKVTGCDFTDVSDACCQFFRVALRFELASESVLGKRRFARELVNKAPDNFSVIMPDAFAAYERARKDKKLPDLLIAEETPDKGFEPVQRRVLRDGGPDFPVAGGDRAIPSGRGAAPMHIPTEEQIRVVYDVLVSLPSMPGRGALLVGIDRAVVQSLPINNVPSVQLLTDLSHLRNMGQITDGSYPIRQYIENAIMLIGRQKGAERLRACLVPVGGGSKPVVVYQVGGNTEQAIWNKLKRHCGVAVRDGLIQFADDAPPVGTSQWEYDERMILSADLVVCLITADTLLDVCRVAERRKIIPVVVRDCAWATSPVGKLAPLPRRGPPIAQASDLDNALMLVAEELVEKAKSIRG